MFRPPEHSLVRQHRGAGGTDLVLGGYTGCQTKLLLFGHRVLSFVIAARVESRRWYLRFVLDGMGSVFHLVVLKYVFMFKSNG